MCCAWHQLLQKQLAAKGRNWNTSGTMPPVYLQTVWACEVHMSVASLPTAARKAIGKKWWQQFQSHAQHLPSNGQRRNDVLATQLNTAT
jgi:hypothetical protein